MKENIDYQLFLDENGLDDSDVRAISEDTSSQMLLNEYYGVSVRASDIEGQGLFADKEIQSGMGVVPALIDGKKTIGFRFANHSDSPNSVIRRIGDNIYLIALRDIATGEEIMTDYRVAKNLQEEMQNGQAEKIGVITAHRKNVTELERTILSMDDQVDLNNTHHWSHMTYCRQMDVPAGVVLTGEIHKYPCTNILISGCIEIVTDQIRERLTAPCIFESGAGVKKAMYAVEDSIFLTVHPWNNEDSLEEVEKKLTFDSYSELESIEA